MTGFGREVEFAAMCHVGRVKSENEDFLVAGEFRSLETMYVPIRGRCELTRPLLFAVADGVSRSPSGDLASRTAINRLFLEARYLHSHEAVSAAIEAAHDAVFELGEAEARHAGMATTLVGLVLRPDGVSWFNVGDSRLYRFRDGFLAQLSVDDVPLAEKRQAKDENRGSSLLSAVLGGRPPKRTLNPHGAAERLAATESRWLLCSDGLSDAVGIEEMERSMALPPLEAVLRLYDRAMQAGGHDNISIIAVQLCPWGGRR